MKIEKIIDLNRTKLDKNGIFINDSVFKKEVEVSKTAWENYYDFSLEDLIEDRRDFDQNKLRDHLEYVEHLQKFSKDIVYLEIGCGPAHIGEHLIKNHDAIFVGVDFNYKMLLTLKKFFEKKGYKKYILIHSDINSMPILSDSIDFIYGGGVIEHSPDTGSIIKESYRILKKGGISFNTVPSLNLWFLLRLCTTIPDVLVVRNIFEFIHEKVLKNKLLKANAGYQLAFTRNRLKALHAGNGFKKIRTGSFAFHPSSFKLSNKFLREIYYRLQKSKFLTAVFYVYGIK